MNGLHLPGSKHLDKRTGQWSNSTVSQRIVKIKSHRPRNKQLKREQHTHTRTSQRAKIMI